MSVTAFAIAPGQNSHGNDSTGAFQPGIEAFRKAYGCPWRLFENLDADAVVRRRVYDAISVHCQPGTDLFAYFGHGIPNGLPSAGIYEQNLDDLVAVLAPKLAPGARVILYACSSGVSGGLTGKLREKLGGDVTVYGHTSVGHSFMNPDVSEASAAGSGWRQLHPLGSELHWAWAECLKFTDLWLRFPVMGDDAVNAELNARRLVGTWEVRGDGATRQYVFDDTDGTAWRADSGGAVDAAPTGTVRAFDPRARGSAADRGTWEVTSDGAAVTWLGGGEENWPLSDGALRVTGQDVRADGTLLTARRISHPFTHGRLQG